jgi:hypothetical protein
MCPEDICCTLFPLMSFPKVSHVRFLMRQQCANALSDNNVLFLHIFSHWVFWSFNEACICHGIRPKGSIKNSSIRGLMGSCHICPDGLIPYVPWWLPYMPWRHLYKWTRCIRESTNEEMAPLIYLCHVCSSVLFLRMGEGDGIYLQLLCASFLGSRTGKWIYQSVNRPILNDEVHGPSRKMGGEDEKG